MHWRLTYIYDHISLIFFSEREMFQTHIVQKSKTAENHAVHEIPRKNMIEPDKPESI
jgi:hypothetical protein